jgi:acyl-coenzyme A thioesterase PaaI-like protein
MHVYEKPVGRVAWLLGFIDLRELLAPGQFPTTVEFKVCFLRPVRLGTVIGRARIVHRGEAMVFAEGDLRDPDNRLLATATATLRIVTIPNVELDFGQGVASHKV